VGNNSAWQVRDGLRLGREAAGSGCPGGAFDLLTATNIVTPLTNWTIARSGAFDSFGNVTVTNGIAFTAPQRYFRIRTP
jgi:hypothetical protein